MPHDNFDDLNKQDNLAPVRLPSGGLHYVHEREVAYFNERRERYQKDNHFTNISDLQDLDRLLVTELLVQRWQTWVSQRRDYWGDDVPENDLMKAIKDHSLGIRQLKKTLGVDKETRDKQRGEDSVESFLSSLRLRAREFGYMRDEQSAKAIELWQRLNGTLTLYQNCDEEERIQQHCTPDEVLQWIINELRPEFDIIDAKFREGVQKMWIRKQ